MEKSDHLQLQDNSSSVVTDVDGKMLNENRRVCKSSVSDDSFIKPEHMEVSQTFLEISHKSVRLQEYVPSSQSLYDVRPPDSEPFRTRSKSAISTESHHRVKNIVSGITLSKPRWTLSIDFFRKHTRGIRSEDKQLPKQVREYYQKQDELIDMFEDDVKEFGTLEAALDQTGSERKDAALALAVDRCAKLTLIINLILVGSKLSAAIATHSLSIISSLVDSFMDVTSGLVIWCASRAIKKRDWYKYPQGRRKLEPVAVLVLSVIMTVASIQVIQEAIQNLVATPERLVFDLISTCIMCATVLVKLCLYIICRRYDSTVLNALAEDHRNDVLSNTVALLGAMLATYVWEYADPIAALLISIYIIINWSMLSREQIRNLTGHTANPQFLQRITWLALNHDRRILAIDTVRAFHFGTNFIVEVDIVLPKEMSLGEAHDIGEPLQQKLERFPGVERAFVHLDYDFEHDPTEEHIHR